MSEVFLSCAVVFFFLLCCLLILYCYGLKSSLEVHLSNLNILELLVKDFLRHIEQIKNMSLYANDDTIIALLTHTKMLSERLEAIRDVLPEGVDIDEILDELEFKETEDDKEKEE